MWNNVLMYRKYINVVMAIVCVMCMKASYV